MEAVAWLGSILLALCGLPQAIRSAILGHAQDVSLIMLYMWLFGEGLLAIYAVHIGSLPLLINYLANVIFVLVILKYRLYPR